MEENTKITFADRAAIFMATGFGLGTAVCRISGALKNRYRVLPERWTGSGLAGSVFATLLVRWGILASGWFTPLVLFVTTFLAILTADRTEKCFQTKDDCRIVIDEFIGIFWTFAFLPWAQLSSAQKLGALALGFVLFRIFDVFKLPLKRAQAWKGGWGVVADDLFAGMLANLFLQSAVRFLF